jgi:hypothetical protein
MKYNLFRGLWKRWEESLEPSFFKWLQDLEDFLRSVLKKGVTFEDHMKGRFLDLSDQLTNTNVLFPNFLSENESKNLIGIWVFKASTHGSLVWSLDNQNLTLNFSSSDPSVNLKLFLAFR